MTETFVSETIEPRAGTFGAAAMGRGEPGLPSGFRWRGDWFEVEAVLDGWKASSREGGRATGELYLRRHYFKLQVSGGETWTVYFERQARRSGSAKSQKQRWFLYTIDSGEDADG